jgi:hypothetical protein
MFCPRCAHENPDEAKFCGRCGATMPTTSTPGSSGSPGSAVERADKVNPATPPKEPFIAALISFFLPGIGQVYLGQRRKGLIIFGIDVLLTIFWLAGGEVWGLIVFGIGVLATIDAYRIGAKLKGGQPVEQMEFF